MQELGALNTTRSITADVKNLGYTINLHNGDLAYAECALHACHVVSCPGPWHCMQSPGPLNVSVRHVLKRKASDRAHGCADSGYLSDWEQYLDMISSYSSLVPFMTQEGVRPPTLNPSLQSTTATSPGHDQLLHVTGAFMTLERPRCLPGRDIPVMIQWLLQVHYLS